MRDERVSISTNNDITKYELRGKGKRYCSYSFIHRSSSTESIFKGLAKKNTARSADRQNNSRPSYHLRAYSPDEQLFLIVHPPGHDGGSCKMENSHQYHGDIGGSERSRWTRSEIRIADDT